MTSDTDETERPDGFFGFLAGLYAAALVAPMVAIWVAVRVTDSPGVLFFTLLGTATVAATGVGLVARRRSLAVWLGRTQWAWAALIPPVAYFVGFALREVAHAQEPPGAIAGLAVVGALSTLIAGLGFAFAARNRHTRVVLDEAEEFARFQAAAPERDRRIAKRVAAGSVVGGAMGWAAAIAVGVEPLRWLFQIVAPMGAGLFGTTTEREYAVTDAGLVVGTPVSKSIRPWREFESYSLSEQALVVHRAGWSAWGLRDLRRDPREIEDAEEVTVALGRFLPPKQAIRTIEMLS